MDTDRTQSRWRAWFELLRLPNLPTVPGDPLAGAALAAACGATFDMMRVAVAAVASLCLYASGLLLNDWADASQDAAERPSRPIPSGRASRPAVLVAAILLGATGIVVATTLGKACAFTAAALMVLILAYDLFTHRVALPGFLNMGLCRAVSLLLGAVAVGWRPAGVDPVRIGGVLLLLYISAVTHVAHRETERRSLGGTRFLPMLLVAGGAAWLAVAVPRLSVAFIVLVVLILWRLQRLTVRLAGEPAPRVVQQSVGEMIRTLALIQAALCTLWVPGGVALALVPVALFALSGLAAKVFYAS